MTMDDLALLLLREKSGDFDNAVKDVFSEEEWQLCSAVLASDYQAALSHCFVLDAFKVNEDSACPLDDLTANINAVLQQSANDSKKQLLLQVVGIAALQAFVQLNWTGPPLAKKVSHLLQWSDKLASTVQAAVLMELSESGEDCYQLSVAPALLWMARYILCEKSSSLQHPTALWWKLRCLMVWQQTLGDKMSSIWEAADGIRQQMTDASSPMAAIFESNQDLKCLLHLELTVCCLVYTQLTPAHGLLQVAMQAAGLESVGLTGALGRRTRFQDFDTAQLTLDVQTRSQGESTVGLSSTEAETDTTSRNVKLDDDTVLDKINFSEPMENKALSSIQLCSVLISCLEVQKSSPGDGLTKEETLAFVEHILSQPKSWSIQSRALLLRCHAEASNTRRMERTMMQLQGIADDFATTSPPAADRLRYFHASNLSPNWMVQSDLAKQLVRLGVVKSALDIFTHLQLWMDVIECLQTLGRQGDAEKLVRERLAVQETPTLLCALGDLTQEPEHYLHAWELSSHRSARAQRSLGRMYLRQGKYKECVEHLQLSLKANSIREGLWFSLGCAAMNIDDLPLAAKAFHRCVTLEYDNFEAWNNLASVHIRMQQKPKAHRVLQASLRCNYEKWQIWHNYMLVCTDVGEFEDLVGALHRLADLSPKHLDDEVLQILVTAIVKGIPDAHGNPSTRLLPKTLKVFGHISSKVTGNQQVWLQYSRLHFLKAEQEGQEGTPEGTAQAQTTKEKALQCVQKAQRLASQHNQLKHSFDVLKSAADLTVQLADDCRLVAKTQPVVASAVQALTSGKLALRGMIVTVKTFTPADGQQDQVAELQRDLEEHLGQITDVIQTLKSAGQ